MCAAIARLTQSMSELTMSHAQHSTSLTKLGEEQRLLEQREKEMREMIARREQDRLRKLAVVSILLRSAFPFLSHPIEVALDTVVGRSDEWCCR